MQKKKKDGPHTKDFVAGAAPARLTSAMAAPDRGPYLDGKRKKEKIIIKR